MAKKRVQRRGKKAKLALTVAEILWVKAQAAKSPVRPAEADEQPPGGGSGGGSGGGGGHTP